MHRYLIAVTTTDVHSGWVEADSEAAARDLALDVMPAHIGENSASMTWRPRLGGRTAELIGTNDIRAVLPVRTAAYCCEGCGKTSRLVAHGPGCPVAAAFDEAFGTDEARKALVRVIANSGELTCATCEATAENCSAHISDCPVYRAKKAAGVTS